MTGQWALEEGVTLCANEFHALMTTRIGCSMSNMAKMREIHPVSDTDLRLCAVSAELTLARQALAVATQNAMAAARDAAAAGQSEVQIAAQLGIARSRTLRRWLGK
ncbi:hypothetical protein A5651_08120 [Mycobacterium sp. 1274761.0]|nr:hypothetical protein A5651_08120 [Mycobacterium sp. 1274761.0]